MASKKETNVMSEEFVMDLLKTCMSDGFVMEIVYHHMSSDYMPDRASADLLDALKYNYGQYNDIPAYSAVKERLRNNKAAIRLLEDIDESSNGLTEQECIDYIEQYIQGVKFQQAYKRAGDLYNRKGAEAAANELLKFAEWKRSFSIADAEFTDICLTFRERFRQNRMRTNTAATTKPITRFYIDTLDERNAQRDLRTQLTCILASTGVGKSHFARWIGSQACLDGLNVLHIQLEGSKEEVENAYSSAIVNCDAYLYERGTLKDEDFNRLASAAESAEGKLYVKTYPKFNNHVSTLDIKEAIAKFNKNHTAKPDVVVIDSMDLLTDASGRKYGENGERHRRIAVANDLKDLAADENVWMVVTYQSTIDQPELVNDENRVLTEYNCAEAKGLARPLTHLITLNQSANERRENTMRINIAKSRFFKKGEPFKIATDYDHERFYHRERTVNLKA